MAERSLESLVDNLQRSAAARDCDLTDGQLLRRFVQARDPAAFELIVWRHGAMVQSVCRRILGRTGESDDAFQATFLVLLKKANRVYCDRSLAGWLYGVAFRVALRCRRATMTRHHHESRAGQPEAQLPKQNDVADVGPILHSEINRLPERLRKPVVLCLVEGRTNEEAARILKVPHGTVLSRLSRARERLRRRLTRRGVAIGAAGLTTALAAEPVSAELINSTIRNSQLFASGTLLSGPVAAVAHGAIQSMFWNKFKLVSVVVIAAALVGGAGTTIVWRLRSKAESAKSNAYRGQPTGNMPFAADGKDDDRTAGDDKAPPAPRKRRGKFTISKETTYVTGPLDKNGYIDYGEALDERMRQGVTPKNNANVLLFKALGTRVFTGKYLPLIIPEFFRRLGIEVPPEKGDYFVNYPQFLQEHKKTDPEKDADEIEKQLSRVRERLWTAKDHPDVADWLRSNEKPLALAIEASKRSRYYFPLVTKEGDQSTSSLGALRPGVYECRRLTEALAARALLKAGEGQVEGAWQDLLACHRLGQLLCHGPTVLEVLTGISTDGSATKADLGFLECPQLSVKQLRQCLADLQKLPARFQIVDQVEIGERFTFLNEFEVVDFVGMDYLEGLSGVGESQKPTAAVARVREAIMDGLEWDAGLRKANGLFDRMTAAMRTTDWNERKRKLDDWDTEMKSIRSNLIDAEGVGKLMSFDPADRGKAISDILICLEMVAMPKVQTSADRNEQEHRNLQIAFALANYERETGHFPETLDALAPKYLSKVPNDLFTGKPLIYRRTESGYMLYSFGPNQKDDEGRGRHDTPEGDDIGIRMPLPKPTEK